jgi:Pyruvate/2-oxoacid:ferredoxin oxidoreductase delta subunit
VQTVALLGLPAAAVSSPAASSPPAPIPALLAVPASPQSIMAVPAPDASQRIDEDTARRWYPVIDYSRCTNCLECIDFCLFGVYGVDRFDTILVEQPDNCRKGCPACSRVCPENAIIFPQHKTPAIAGSPVGEAGSFKIDLSKLFGAPDALEVAVLERDVELVAVGRDAVGMQVGIPKRQTHSATGPRDELDALIDELDGLSL